MPRPVMSLDEFRDRFLLEIWLHCEGDLAEQFDPHEVAESLLAKHPRAKRSWISPAVPAMEREGCISRFSHDDTIPHADEGKFYLTESGARWCDRYHNEYVGYRDEDHTDNSDADGGLSNGLVLSGSAVAPRVSRGPIVVGRIPVGQGYIARSPPDQTVQFDTSHSRETVSPGTPILAEDGTPLLAEDGRPLLAEEPAIYSEYAGPQAIPMPAEHIIHLDRKRPLWDEFAQELRALSEAVRGHNSETDEQRAQTQRVAVQLEAGARLVEGSHVDVDVLKAVIVGALSWIALTFLDGMVSDMGAHAGEQFRMLLGM